MAAPADRKDTRSSARSGSGIHAGASRVISALGLEAPRGQTSILRQGVIPGGHSFHAPLLFSNLGTDVNLTCA